MPAKTKEAPVKIAVMGTGYVGLVTAVGLAEFGNTVVGTDKVEDKVVRINRGEVPIYEPGLEALLRKNLKKGNLNFTTKVAQTVRAADVIFLCVGTPEAHDRSADMSQIEEVARLIAENLNGYKLIVEKSTVPVKTSSWIKRTIALYRRSNKPFDVASNPEFLREGSAVGDFLDPDRIIIGVETDRARDLLLRIYGPMKDRVYLTNIETAELIKHASNAFLAMKISYINLMAEICERTDADIELVARGMGLDPRIGDRFLKAGAGFGGSCFPKDLKALIRIGDELGVDMGLLRETENINADRTRVLLEKVKKALWILKDKTVAVLGLAFKPDTDDIREAPSTRLIRELLAAGSQVRLCDPQAMANMKQVFPEEAGKVAYCESPIEAAKGANALLVLTEWQEFVDLDLARVREDMANRIVIDGRNIYDPDRVRGLGFEYYSIGRK
jgi:UDPglucose 6-dehydrogenase